MKNLKLFALFCFVLPSWSLQTIAKEHFFQKVSERQKEFQTHLCLGMDPREAWFTNSKENYWFQNPTKECNKKTIVTWGKQLIDQTENTICCIKPNLAFYTQIGPEGLEALKEIICYAKTKNIPVLLDAKYGDIGSTAAAYARTAFEYFDADGVTLSPYLGYDTVKPFLEYENKAVFVLAKTSNPSSKDFQNITASDGTYIYEEIAKKARLWGDRVGVVVGATMPEHAKRIREKNEKSWILAPGIGAQGGDIEKIVAAAGKNIIFPISRGISHNENLNPGDAALFYKNEIEKRINKTEGITSNLLDHEIVKFGQFTLKSGSVSPIYIDLRSIISYPTLFDAIVDQYIKTIEENNIECDRIAGIAYGALGTAFRVASILKKPVLLIKKENEKQYGIDTKGLIGQYQKGEKVLLIEDIATSGGSTLNVAEKLRSHGLEVTDAVVFLDRQANAKDNLAQKNIKMHSVITLSRLLDVLKGAKKISDQTYKTVHTFMSSAKKK